jgi:hypothetical protein
VKYQQLYPGIDLVYYGKQQQLEYDFLVAPGADPNVIRLSYEGTDKLEVDGRGDLILHTASGKFIQHAPRIYQEANGSRQSIPGRYILLETGSSPLGTDYALGSSQPVGFVVDGYDTSRTLVIDPVLVYSTYLGGSEEESGIGIMVDSAGNAYVTGNTTSSNFPTVNPVQPTNSNESLDAFVTKLNAAGTALVYSTYLGGTGQDRGFGIRVDAAGNAYVTGDTRSLDFPILNPLQPALDAGNCESNGQPIPCSDAFVAKLSAAGNALVYSSYLGGGNSDVGIGITLDNAGNAYVTGNTRSLDFPILNPLQPALGGGNCEFNAEPGPCPDAFVMKVNAAGSALVYSTYLGGSNLDLGLDIAVDSAGNVYLTGDSSSTDFPTVNPLQPTLKGSMDAFVAKVNAPGTALVYSTYLGGSSSENFNPQISPYVGGIAIDSAGNAYVTGNTDSPDFPTQNPLQPALNGVTDAFVTKLNAAGSSLVYSTYLGGGYIDYGFGIALDSTGNAYVTGITYSSDFPTVNPVQATRGGVDGGGTDAFVTILNAAGSALVFSTYFGDTGHDWGIGIAVDLAGNTYFTGTTDFGSDSHPTQAFVAKISTASADATPPTCVLTARGTNAAGQKYIKITCQDTGSGLASIEVIQVRNFRVRIPSFTVGTTSPVVITATKVDNLLGSSIALNATDVAGNATLFDPVDLQIDRKTGKPVRYTLTGIPRTESQIAIYNGNPGLTTLTIKVNGTSLIVASLRNNEVRNIDVSSLMVEGDNTITLTAYGKPGANATILIHD